MGVKDGAATARLARPVGRGRWVKGAAAIAAVYRQVRSAELSDRLAPGGRTSCGIVRSEPEHLYHAGAAEVREKRYLRPWHKPAGPLFAILSPCDSPPPASALTQRNGIARQRLAVYMWEGPPATPRRRRSAPTARRPSLGPRGAECRQRTPSRGLLRAARRCWRCGKVAAEPLAVLWREAPAPAMPGLRLADRCSDAEAPPREPTDDWSWASRNSAPGQSCCRHRQRRRRRSMPAKSRAKARVTVDGADHVLRAARVRSSMPGRASDTACGRGWAGARRGLDLHLCVYTRVAACRAAGQRYTGITVFRSGLPLRRTALPETAGPGAAVVFFREASRLTGLRLDMLLGGVTAVLADGREPESCLGHARSVRLALGCCPSTARAVRRGTARTHAREPSRKGSAKKGRGRPRLQPAPDFRDTADAAPALPPR